MKKLIAVFAVVAVMAGGVASADLVTFCVDHVKGQDTARQSGDFEGYTPTGGWYAGRMDGENNPRPITATDGTVTWEFCVTEAPGNQDYRVSSWGGTSVRGDGAYCEVDWNRDNSWRFSGLTPSSTVDILLILGSQYAEDPGTAGLGWNRDDPFARQADNDTFIDDAVVDANGEVLGNWWVTGGGGGGYNLGGVIIQYTAADPIAEPAALGLLGVGLLALRRRRS